MAIYDWNGTTAHEIGKVYDWNGTTNSLIYQSQVFVIDTAQSITPNTWTVKSYDGNYSRVSTSYSATGGLYLWVDNNYGGTTEQVQRDFSKYSNITINVSSRNSVGNNLWETYFGVITSTTGEPFYGPSMQTSISITGTGTYTLNLSNYNGTGYLALYQRGFGAVTINKIILE